MKIGIISDTHGFVHSRIISFFENMDEIWHAGDIGSPEVILKLLEIAPVRAVHGNIDDYKMRLQFPEFQEFTIGNLKILITHIAGASGKYLPEIQDKLRIFKPDIFVCGHSHILKVQHIEKYGHLYLNPGAAGMNGFHRSLTAIRMQIDDEKPSKLEVLDIPRG
jgi:uncharacterized protein